jgi:RNA-directed DNA polymerase
VSLATPAKLRTLQRALYVTAKREPARRFHALYDKVWREDILAHAFALSQENGGAPGVDGVTFVQIEAYGVARWLGELREEVRTGRYTPQSVRRVMIPKSGGVGQRPLGIPTIRDRVVQTAAKLVIEPIFEADFDEAAYGYRPRRSAHEAIRVVHKALDDGRTEVVDADLSQYFDTIPHAALMTCLARRISDGRMLHLLKGWLKVPVAELDERGVQRMSGGKRATRGTPQGGVVSPLLANIYMHRYIKAFRRYGLDQKYGAQLVMSYCQELWNEGDQAATFFRFRDGCGSTRVPSLKSTPARTSGTSSAPSRRRQWPWAACSSLNAITSPAVREPAPLVTPSRSRTVANVDSIGLVVRRCFQCSAG